MTEMQWEEYGCRHLDVGKINGRWSILTDGFARAIFHKGHPVAEFEPGWRAVSGCLVDEDLLIILLKHQDGRDAQWYLNGKLERIAGDAGELPEPVRERCLDKLVIVARRGWSALVCAMDFSADRALALIILHTRNLILQMADRIIEIIEVHECRIDIWSSSLDVSGLPLVALKVVEVAKIWLSGSWMETLLSWKEGANFPLAFGDAGVQCAGAFILPSYGIAYRLVTTALSEPFYIILLHHETVAVGIYLPRSRLFFPANLRPSLQIDKVARLFFRHIVEFSTELDAYLLGQFSLPTTYLFRSTFDQHIGMYLWAILSGFEHLYLNEYFHRVNQQIIVIDAPLGSEKFGAICDLYPSLQVPIISSLRGYQNVVSYVYQSRMLPAHAGHHFIPKSLSERIVRVALKKTDASTIRRPLTEGGVTVLIGLRVENRTAINLVSLIVDIIRGLLERFDRVTIILDGHNSSEQDPEKIFKSDFEHLAADAPIEVERRVVTLVNRIFDDEERLSIVDNIGGTIQDSITWCMLSDFFVTFWGAGLAKYRWVCNKVGLCITSNWNMNNRADRDIYNSENYMEGPTRMYWADPEFVLDRPDCPVLFLGPNFGPASNASFEVSSLHILSRIDEIVEFIRIR